MGDFVRIPYFENAKLILIVLVVVGHVIGHIDDRFLHAVTMTIYSFHMPAFVFIAGYFTKRASFSPKLFSQYIIFQSIFLIIGWYFKQEVQWLSILSPFLVLWFLFSLITWKLLVQIVSRIKYPFLVFAVLSALFGYFDQIGEFLSIAKTVFFFPFFLLGYTLKNKPSDQFNFNKYLGVAVLISIFLFFYYRESTNLLWFSGLPYSRMGLSGWQAGFSRIAVYILFIISSISFLSIVPQQRFTLTKLGENTLIVYLLHEIPIYLLYLLSFFKSIDTLMEKVAAIVVAVLFALLLSYIPVFWKGFTSLVKRSNA